MGSSIRRIRGCCAKARRDEYALALSAGQGVERPVCELLGFGESHGFPHDTVVFPTLDLEASQMRIAAHEHQLYGREAVGVRGDLGNEREGRGNVLG